MYVYIAYTNPQSLHQCDVKWDSGLKPEVDNTYYIYQTGNDGLYHLALVEETPWKVRSPLLLKLTEVPLLL